MALATRNWSSQLQFLIRFKKAFCESIFSIAHTYKAKGTINICDLISDNVAMQLHERNKSAWNECTTNLYLLNWHLRKENVNGWWGIDTSNEIATGELMDDSNFNIITWYQWAIKRYGDWCLLYQRNAVQAFWKVSSFIMIYRYILTMLKIQKVIRPKPY